MMKLLLAFALSTIWTGNAFAVPEITNLRITDVTTASFSVVWMTNIVADPNVEVFSDSSMINSLNEAVVITPMPDASREIVDAARIKGIMKIRVSNLASNTRYYVRALTADPASPLNVAYSPMQEVTTTASVTPYKLDGDGSIKSFANDLLSMRVFIAPTETNPLPGLGDLLLLETAASPYPISSYVGAGAVAPEGVIDLNNLFNANFTSLNMAGDEKVLLRIYRGGILSTLLHYRKLPVTAGLVSVADPVKGFFADVNLDGKIDAEDFTEFRKQYRTAPNDSNYNPDFNFTGDPAGVIDARNFAKFAREYGRTNVQ